MEFVAGLSGHPQGPEARLVARQSEGWHGVTLADHLSDRGTYPHVWVTLGHWAALDHRMVLGTTFANNLDRPPWRRERSP